MIRGLLYWAPTISQRYKNRLALSTLSERLEWGKIAEAFPVGKASVIKRNVSDYLLIIKRREMSKPADRTRTRYIPWAKPERSSALRSLKEGTCVENSS